VKYDIDELKLQAEQMEAAAKRAIEEAAEMRQEKTTAILEAN